MMASAYCASLLREGIIVDYAPRHLIVEISSQENCEQCAQGRGCGVGLLARRRSQRIAVALPVKAHGIEECYPLGNQVTISLPRASVTLLAFFCLCAAVNARIAAIRHSFIRQFHDLASAADFFHCLGWRCSRCEMSFARSKGTLSPALGQLVRQFRSPESQCELLICL